MADIELAINSDMKYMKDTNTLLYSNEHQKQFTIDIFSKPCNGGYKLITDDYLESESLQKGIILKYKEPKVVEGFLTHNIL